MKYPQLCVSGFSLSHILCASLSLSPHIRTPLGGEWSRSWLHPPTINTISINKWAMQYVDSNKKGVLLTTRNKGRGQRTKDIPFSYGRILRLDYEDPDSKNLILLVECSKGVRKMWVSENVLVKDSCGPESFKLEIVFTNNLITTLRTYI